MKKALLALLCSLLLISTSFCQISLISASNGGFENATQTFAANGWTSVDGSDYIWNVGSAAGSNSGSNAAFFGPDNTTYSGASAQTAVHFYRDIAIPAGGTAITLSFYLLYPVIDDGYDYFTVYTTTTSRTPVGDVVPGSGYTIVYQNTSNTYNTFTKQTIVLPNTLAGTTVRLVFTFANDGYLPEADPAVDDISLVYTCAAPSITTQPAVTQTVCAGNSVSFSVAATGAGLTYQWKKGSTNLTNGGNISGATSSTLTLNPVAVGDAASNYKVVITGTCGSVTSNYSNLNVNASPATPTITAGGSTTFCAGGSVTLTSSAGTTYLWSTGATTSSISPSTSGSYTVRVTNASGCQSASSSAKVVTVNALPATPTITAGGPTTFCTGGSVTLTSSAGTTYLWSTGATTSSISPTTSGSYTVRVTNASGCQSASSTAKVVTVNATPAAPTASVMQPTCTVATGTINITAPTGAGMTYSTDGITYTNTTGVFNSMSAGTYSITAMNSSGCISSITSVTVNVQPTTPNISQIPTSNLIANYKFNGNANDATGNDNGTLQNSPASTADRFSISTAAYNFNGSNQYVSTANSYTNPTNFTVSIWFKTNTASGGKLIGFGNAQTGSSSNYDRHIYMNNAGQIYFGVYPGTVVTVSSTLSYNDNNWHLATATLSSTTGMALYVDGVLVGSKASTLTAQNYTGYWRIGYDNTNGWTSKPSSYYFNGTLDDALIYSRALSASEVTTLYNSPDGAGNNGPVCAGSSLSFSATTVSSATYAWTGPNSFTSSAQNPTLSYTAANAGVYTLVVTSSGGCTATAYTNVVSNTFPGQWTGNINTNWNNANNWCSGILPSITTNVTIPGSLTNYPLLSSGTGTVNNITIQSGASVTVTGGTLQIAGSISNSGTFDASTGTIEMNGSAAQTIPANTFVSNALNNLIISNTSTGVTLGGTLNLFGTLSFGAVNSKTFSTNGYLTLKSSATATAGVADLTNNGSNSGNTVTGNVTVERYISAAKKWRFLSIPTSSTQTIKAAWQEGCGANLNCVPNFGTQITGPGGTAAGFDVYSGSPSMKTYNTATNSWTAIPNTNAALINNLSNNTVAYLIFIRGDRSATTTSSPVSSTILRTAGAIKQGDQAAVTIAAPATAYTAVGNPYPSRIDLTKMTPAPTTSTKIYVFDPIATSGSAYGYGAYQTLTYNGTNFSVTPGGGSYGAPYNQNPNYIESGEAFFVGGNTSAYNITFKENIKASGNNLVFFAARNPQYAEANLFINNNGVTTLMDGTRADISSAFSNSLDNNDAYKIANSTENVSLKRDGQLLSVERHNSITSSDTFYLNISNVRVQNYEWQLNMNNLDQPGLSGFLEDNYLHTSTPLNLNGSTVVNFSIANIPGSYAADRFRIVFMPAAVLPLTFTNVKAYQKNKDIAVEWSVENESNLKQYGVEKSADGNLFATAYTVAANNAALSNYKWLDVQPLAGNNYYRIRSTDVNGQTAYSNVVKVNMGTMKQSISIYPNPVINGTINIQLNNEPAGIYSIRMLNKSGQTIMERQIQHAEGTSTETIQFNKYLPHGIYQMEVTKSGGMQTTINLIY